MLISAEIRARIDAEAARYPKRRGALLPALHMVQAELGCIDEEATRELAEIFQLRPLEILEVVSFYNMFDRRPLGRHRVNLCTNLSCSLRGGRTLLRQLEGHLGVACGETTADGRITLGHEECLGACDGAPMMRIDARYHEGLNFESAKQLLDALE